MIVVSNTSPLNYLVLIEAVDVMPQLFGRVYAPPSVLSELRDERAPEIVRSWSAAPPSWLEIRAPHAVDDSLGLHLGETEAIALAEEMKVALLLVENATRSKQLNNAACRRLARWR